jgi:hypothetical protein
MLRAVERANRWLLDPADRLTPDRLPEDMRWLARHSDTLRTYAQEGLWSSGTGIDMDAAQRWRDILHEATIVPDVDVRTVLADAPFV